MHFGRICSWSVKRSDVTKILILCKIINKMNLQGMWKPLIVEGILLSEGNKYEVEEKLGKKQ